MDFFGTQKRPFLRKSHFFLSSRAAFISNENFHISLAHWSHDELSHFDSRHAAHGNTKGLWAPLKMLLEQWVKTTFTQSNGVAHSPFFSCSRSLSRSLSSEKTLSYQTMLPAGRYFCACEVTDEPRTNPICGCGSMRMDPIEGEAHLAAMTSCGVEIFGLLMNHRKE